MSEFTRGFGHGFMLGVFNRMYGGWGFGCGRFNFFCNCNQPLFFTPQMNFNNFNRYITPMANLNLPTFNLPKQNFTMPSFNFNLPIFTSAQYIMPQTRQTNFNFEHKPSTSWNSVSGDTFVRTENSYSHSETVSKQITVSPKTPTSTPITTPASISTVTTPLATNTTYAASNLKTQAKSSSKPKTGEISDKDNTTYDTLIVKYSKKHGVDPNLIKAMIKQESSFNPNAKSGAGAVGLMQLMPDTANEVGVSDRTDPEQSIEGGVKYIKKKIKEQNGDIKLALAAYNAGSDNVKGKIPQNGETPEFVERVMKYYNEYQNS